MQFAQSPIFMCLYYKNNKNLIVSFVFFLYFCIDYLNNANNERNQSIISCLWHVHNVPSHDGMGVLLQENRTCEETNRSADASCGCTICQGPRVHASLLFRRYSYGTHSHKPRHCHGAAICTYTGRVLPPRLAHNACGIVF